MITAFAFRSATMAIITVVLTIKSLMSVDSCLKLMQAKFNPFIAALVATRQAAGALAATKQAAGALEPLD